MNFNPIDLTSFIGFFVVVIGLSIWKSRRASDQAENTSDFFLGGRGLAWPLIGISIVAANISTEQMVGMAGQAAGSVGLAVSAWQLVGSLGIVVNAAGVWSDSVRAMDEGTNPHSIRPAKGIHITVPWEKVRNDIATIVPVPKDRRSIFVVPWGDFTYIGTTDTDYDGDTEDPQCTPEDVRYCLDAMNLAMSTPLTEADVTGVWAGLRPLIAGGSVGDKTKDLSRKHGVTTSEGGVTTITGGKLTTYRRMAADTIDAVADRLGVKGAKGKPDRDARGGLSQKDGGEKIILGEDVLHDDLVPREYFGG